MKTLSDIHSIERHLGEMITCHEGGGLQTSVHRLCLEVVGQAMLMVCAEDSLLSLMPSASESLAIRLPWHEGNRLTMGDQTLCQLVRLVQRCQPHHLRHLEIRLNGRNLDASRCAALLHAVQSRRMRAGVGISLSQTRLPRGRLVLHIQTVAAIDSLALRNLIVAAVAASVDAVLVHWETSVDGDPRPAESLTDLGTCLADALRNNEGPEVFRLDLSGMRHVMGATVWRQLWQALTQFRRLVALCLKLDGIPLGWNFLPWQPEPLAQVRRMELGLQATRLDNQGAASLLLQLFSQAPSLEVLRLDLRNNCLLLDHRLALPAQPCPATMRFMMLDLRGNPSENGGPLRWHTDLRLPAAVHCHVLC